MGVSCSKLAKKMENDRRMLRPQKELGAKGDW